MKKTLKTAVYFIATKVKNHPVSVSYYTHAGKQVSENKVEKTRSEIRGTSFYAAL